MSLKPSKTQLDFLNWELGIFFHFGIRTFNPGHRDWDGIEMDINSFNPDKLDCNQWMREIKKLGAKYAILTTKHHDGFANWPTKYSNYSVKNCKWRDGKGDIVKEFTDACRKANIKIGLYYSPAQWGSSAVVFENEKEYDDYFINQVSELLTNYGKIDYLWFDACGSDNHKYDEKRIINVIRGLQPDILIFSMWDPDTTWIGNEDGYAPLDNRYIVNCNVLGENKEIFCPGECDCKLRDHWFFDNDIYSIKTVDELVGMYEYSVGRGSNMLINIGPDNHGLLCDLDLIRMNQWKCELDKRYGKPVPMTVKHKSKNIISVEYNEEILKQIKDTTFIPSVSSVILEEDITDGQKIFEYKVYANIPTVSYISTRKYCVYEGNTIGHKAICRFAPVRTPKITVEITKYEPGFKIKSLKVFE